MGIPNLDFNNMSKTRRIALTVMGVLYALALLGNAGRGFSAILGISLFFLTITCVVFLWVK